MLDIFSLEGKRVLICGSEGLFGSIQKRLVLELGGEYLSVDITGKTDYQCDLGNRFRVNTLAEQLPEIHVIINNMVGNQQPVKDPNHGWNDDISAGLTSVANVCGILGDKIFHNGGGAILNMGSDLSLIAPDHSLYLDGKLKPASYSAVKHGIIGLTRYYGTLWHNVRCNCLCPGGLDVGQKVPKVPLARLAKPEDMIGPISLLITEASSYMTGSIVVVDGGRTAW
jgi:NAD(P)-dependent dehydrogenase (short-subunit alcohol dehydrogenase family)